MPHRTANIAQVDITRLIRAAKAVGAVEVFMDMEGNIHVVLPPGSYVATLAPTKSKDQVWELSTPHEKKKRWSSRDATSWRDIPKDKLRH
jgi:hypothetical protein